MKIIVEKHINHPVKIEQTRVQRDWMDATDGQHAYKCFPITLANSIGWSISFLNDIEFIWDGVSDSTDTHVTILQDKGGVCSTGRANGTISFYSGLFFRTDQNMSLMSIVPPNHFIDGAMPFTSIISTSFFEDAYPIAWKITRPNIKILIPAGTPVATLIPIPLGNLSKIELDVHNKEFDPDIHVKHNAKIEAWKKISADGKFTNFYRDAVDYEGVSVGKHEIKSLYLKINDFTQGEGL